jgi:hypothetical protein
VEYEEREGRNKGRRLLEDKEEDERETDKEKGKARRGQYSRGIEVFFLKSWL